jgi:hypothetical protein
MARVWRTSPRFGPSSVARSFFVLTRSLFADRSSGSGTRHPTELIGLARTRQTEKQGKKSSVTALFNKNRNHGATGPVNFIVTRNIQGNNHRFFCYAKRIRNVIGAGGDAGGQEEERGRSSQPRTTFLL